MKRTLLIFMLCFLFSLPIVSYASDITIAVPNVTLAVEGGNLNFTDIKASYYGYRSGKVIGVLENGTSNPIKSATFSINLVDHKGSVLEGDSSFTISNIKPGEKRFFQFMFNSAKRTESVSEVYITPLDISIDKPPVVKKPPVKEPVSQPTVKPVSSTEINQLKASLADYTWKNVWFVMRPDSKDLTTKFSNLSHLDPLVIEFLDLDHYVIVLHNKDGQQVEWKPNAIINLQKQGASTGQLLNMMQTVLQRSFFTENPYSQYGISAETWDNIKNQQPQIGWGQTECYLAFGEPLKVEQLPSIAGPTETWKYDGNKTLYFGNNILIDIKN